jgi:hypothetical protein
MDGRNPPPRAVRDLAVGKDTAHEPLPVLRERAGYPMDVGGVNPETDDVRHL